MATQDLFRDDCLAVRKVGTGSPVCVVTFVPRTSNRTLHRKGFAEDFLCKSGIDAIHVICNEDRWFHEASIFDAMEAIAKSCAGYDRVLTYGSSMGGYGAIKFAGLIGAHAAIAFSPQFSIDRTICPFEGRWGAEAEQISFMPAIDAAPKLTGETFLFYDSKDTDVHHAKMYADAYENVRLIDMPGAGHPCIAFLHEKELLRPIIIDIAFGRFDPLAPLPVAAADYYPKGNAEI